MILQVGKEYKLEDIVEEIKKKMAAEYGNKWTVDDYGPYANGKNIVVYTEIEGVGVMTFLLTGKGIYKLVYWYE